MYFHIIVESNNNQKIRGENQKIRGKASSVDELFRILTKKEIQTIFRFDGFKILQRIFKAGRIASEDSYTTDLGGVSCDFISNGYEITTIVFNF